MRKGLFPSAGSDATAIGSTSSNWVAPLKIEVSRPPRTSSLSAHKSAQSSGQIFLIFPWQHPPCRLEGINANYVRRALRVYRSARVTLIIECTRRDDSFQREYMSLWCKTRSLVTGQGQGPGGSRSRGLSRVPKPIILIRMRAPSLIFGNAYSCSASICSVFSSKKRHSPRLRECPTS